MQEEVVEWERVLNAEREKEALKGRWIEWEEQGVGL